MRTLSILLFSLFVGFTAGAQSVSKVAWKYSAQKISDGKYEVHLTATIQPGWHLYSQTQSSDAIALPTTITFTKNPLLSLAGKTEEKGKVFDQFDRATASRSRYYNGTVDFVQIVQVRGNVTTSVTGEIEFMVCNDEKCLPPDRVKFSVKL